MKTPVLFARRDSVYKDLNCDVYDFDRDATTYKGTQAVIAHPPCRSWGQLAPFAKPRRGEWWLTIWAVLLIRRNGGVLEHPYGSKIKSKMQMPKPGKYDRWGGILLNVNQHWWGHKAQKKTLLYIVGLRYNELPQMPLNFNGVEFYVQLPKGKKGREISKADRERTPPDLAAWLIEVQRRIESKKKPRRAEPCNSNTIQKWKVSK
jgi:hypothetical protein